MRRALIGIALGFGLLVGGSASALVITSGEVPLSAQLGSASLTLTILQPAWNTPVYSVDAPAVLRPGGFGRRSFAWSNDEPWRSPGQLHRIAARLFPRALPRHLELPLLDGPLFHPRLPARLIDPIPEPGTGLLFGAGLLWLGLARRARR